MPGVNRVELSFLFNLFQKQKRKNDTVLFCEVCW